MAQPLWETDPKYSHINRGLKPGDRVYIVINEPITSTEDKILGTIENFTKNALDKYIHLFNTELIVARWDDNGRIDFDYVDKCYHAATGTPILDWIKQNVRGKPMKQHEVLVGNVYEVKNWSGNFYQTGDHWEIKKIDNNDRVTFYCSQTAELDCTFVSYIEELLAIGELEEVIDDDFSVAEKKTYIIKQNNDGRDFCFACGTPTKRIDTGLFSDMRICKKCGK